MYPEIFSIGPITIHSYGLMLAIAFMASSHLYSLELRRRGLDPEIAGTVLTWAVVGGLVGARIYYLFEFWPQVKGELLKAMFATSGLVAYGGFMLAVPLCLWAIKRRGAPVLVCADACAPMLALGYAIGRVGCFLAGDGDYGPPSDLPWAMPFPNGVVPTTVPVHPTPLYEIAMMLAVFAILWTLRTRPWPPGRLFALYLVLQGTERFVAEFWRLNEAWSFGLSGAQFVAIGSTLLGLIWLMMLAGKSAESNLQPG